jgi:hypothetical protein
VDNSNPNSTNATLPGPLDDVTIASTDPSLVLQINYVAQFASLTVANASLVVVANTNASLAATSLYLGEEASLAVQAGSSVNAPTSNYTFTLTPTAALSVSSGGAFEWYGAATFLGTVTVETDASFFINSVTVWAPVASTLDGALTVGYLNVTNNVAFNGGLEVFELTVAPAVTVTIGTSFTGAIVVGANASVTIDTIVAFNIYGTSPFSGSGSVIIVDSTGVVNSSAPSTFNGTLSLSGTTLTLIGLTLPNLATDDDVTITANGVVLNGNNVTLLGQISVTGNGLTISGTPYTAAVNVDNSTLTVSGVFFATPLTLSNSATLNLGGLIHSSVTIPPSSVFVVTSTSQIVGSLVNQGSVNVTTTDSLEIWSGDYTQSNGTFSVLLDKTDQAALNVLNGSIFLNGGGIQFSIKDKPFLKSAKFLVAQANITVNGTFTGDASPLEGSAIDRTLSVKYEQNPNAIYIQYSFNPKDVEYWMWIVLGVVVALILVVIIAVVVKCRKRNQYESLGK